jgi:two-component system CheB/CheR fusion protein
VQDRQGRWYSLRIRPYRTADNKIDGAVLTLFDINAPKRHEGSVRSDGAPQVMP